MDQQNEWSEKFHELFDKNIWVKDFAHGLLCETDISPLGKRIFLFTFLWMIFEQRILNKHAQNPGNERDKMLILCRKLKNSEKCKIDSRLFEAELKYFRDRYFDRGNPTYQFDELFPKEGKNIAMKDREYLLKTLGCKKEPQPQEIASGLLVLMYRYRNRLFHGAKWSEGLGDQFENFDNANSVLVKAIDIQILKELA